MSTLILMEVKKIIAQHRKIGLMVSEKRVKQSLDILSDMINVSINGELRDEYELIVLTYRNMLTYTIDGINDPERSKVYFKLIQSILKLSDRVLQDILSHNSGWHTYWVKQQLEREQKLTGRSIVGKVDDLMFRQELNEWLRLTRESGSDPESVFARKHRQLISNIFNHLWLTDYYGEAESDLLNIILTSGKFKWHETSIFCTALTLSSFRVWQPEKMFHLANMYESGQDQVRERALTGLILNLHFYNSRVRFYPEINNLVSRLTDSSGFREHCRIIVLQAIRSKETERLGRRLTDEILPQVAKLKPRIEEKLDMGNILSGEKPDGKNPDWSDMFSETEEIYKTMEELNKLQMEGADVYMSAFANLKHFDFFKDFQNWFVPFFPDHDVVNEIFTDEILGPGTNELAEGLYETPFICNSDKYSLLLNLKHLPTAQKSMMLRVFRMELDGLRQMNEDDSLTDPSRKFRTTVTQYLHDIYRFFKLSPYKKEFEDIFDDRLDIYNSEFYRMACSSREAEAGLADYFFGKDFYEESLELYKKMIPERTDESQLYEKAGYCCQQMSDYDEALVYYKKAELIDRKPWTLKKIGACLRRLGRTEEALEYYLQAGNIDKNDLHTTVIIANCYLDLKEYNEALKYYFRIEYTEPGNIKILRPIAYCYLALGRFEESKKYYDQLSADKLNSHDLINMGHLALCEGNRKEAADYYRRSILTGEITKERFITLYSDDTPLLISLGVSEDEIPIILDYILFITG